MRNQAGTGTSSASVPFDVAHRASPLTYNGSVIEDSWRRSALAGLDPGSVPVVEVVGTNGETRLLRAARPVLHSLKDSMGEMDFGVLLVDSRGVIQDRCFGTTKTAARVDRLGGSPGTRITEETWGTNALATPIEIRHPIFISGEEHYLEVLKSVSCFGMPILHPLTRRLEGVLDLVCRTEDASPLMRPVVATAVRDIQERLVQDSSETTSSAFNAFRKACASTKSPILLVDQDEMYCNLYASDAFTGTDYNIVREAISGAAGNGIYEVTLSSGLDASLRVTTPGREGQQLIAVSFADRDRRVIPRRHQIDASIYGQSIDTMLAEARSGEGHVLITGELGTGKTRAASSIQSSVPNRGGVDAFDISDNEVQFLTELRTLLSYPNEIVVIENIDALSPTVANRIASMLRDSPARVVCTSSTGPARNSVIENIATVCTWQVHLPALRERRNAFASIANNMISHLGGVDRRLTLPALEVLAAQDWPGNHGELEHVLKQMLAIRTTGDLSALDVPSRYRTTKSATSLSPLEQAERNAIIDALAVCRGNKVHTAQRLSISRSKLYSRMRALGIH